MTGPSPRRIAAAAAAVAAALLAPAGAHAAGVGSGTTKLELDLATLRALGNLGVRIVSDPPAQVQGRRSIGFPITDGDVGPGTGDGFAAHRGAAILRRGSRSVALRFPRLRLAGSRGTLTARVGGDRLTVARTSTRGARVSRVGIDTRVRGVRLELTAAAARALERGLGVDGLRGGMALGRTTSTFVFREVAVAGGGTTVSLDPAFARTLEQEGITATPTGRTEVRPAGLLFPIGSGSLGRDTVVGLLRHGGGLTFAEGGSSVALDRPTLDLGRRPSLTALVGAERMAIAGVDTAQAVAGRGADVRTRLLRGLVLRLSADAAQAFNAAFATTAFAAGQVVGTAGVAARAR